MIGRGWLLAMLVAATPAAVVAHPLDRLAPGAPVCFARSYSAEHLAAHPTQNVADIAVKLEREATADGVWDTMVITATLRGPGFEPGRYRAGMVCWLAEGQRFCGIECDGGTVLLRPGTARSADGLTIENQGFLVRGHCADEGEIGVSLDADAGGDDVFALDPVPAADCAAISGVR